MQPLKHVREEKTLSVSRCSRRRYRKRRAKSMAKRIIHEIPKKRIIKRRKNKFIHKAIDYLTSDCYLFAPLISSSFASTKGIEIRERTRDQRSLLKQIEDYLKSDCYMYASLVIPQSGSISAPKELGSVACVKKISLEVSRTATIIEGEKLISESAANLVTGKRYQTADIVEAVIPERQNKVHKESVKRMIHPNIRSSSIRRRD